MNINDILNSTIAGLICASILTLVGFLYKKYKENNLKTFLY